MISRVFPTLVTFWISDFSLWPHFGFRILRRGVPRNWGVEPVTETSNDCSGQAMPRARPRLLLRIRCGKISQIIGPVVDLAAADDTSAVEVTVSQAIQVQGVTCEVQQLLGEGTIR